MGLLVALLVLAVIAFVLGFVVAAKWLFIIAAVLLVIGILSYFVGPWGHHSRTY